MIKSILLFVTAVVINPILAMAQLDNERVPPSTTKCQEYVKQLYVRLNVELSNMAGVNQEKPKFSYPSNGPISISHGNEEVSRYIKIKGGVSVEDKQYVVKYEEYKKNPNSYKEDTNPPLVHTARFDLNDCRFLGYGVSKKRSDDPNEPENYAYYLGADENCNFATDKNALSDRSSELIAPILMCNKIKQKNEKQFQLTKVSTSPLPATQPPHENSSLPKTLTSDTEEKGCSAVLRNPEFYKSMCAMARDVEPVINKGRIQQSIYNKPPDLPKKRSKAI